MCLVLPFLISSLASAPAATGVSPDVHFLFQAFAYGLPALLVLAGLWQLLLKRAGQLPIRTRTQPRRPVTYTTKRTRRARAYR